MITEFIFLYDTNIAALAFNEKAVMKRNKKKSSRGHRISLMVMIQMVLNYSEVHTDIMCVDILTCPLEHRSRTKSCNKSSTVDDGLDLEI